MLCLYFYWICGKYRVVNQGEGELLQISQKLYQPIEKYRPIDRDLSPNWQGIGKAEKKVLAVDYPHFFIYILLGFVLIALYIGLLTSLKTKVEPIYQKKLNLLDGMILYFRLMKANRNQLMWTPLPIH